MKREVLAKARETRATYQAQMDALWEAFKRGDMSHDKYRAAVEPLEAELRTKLNAIYQEHT